MLIIFGGKEFRVKLSSTTLKPRAPIFFFISLLLFNLLVSVTTYCHSIASYLPHSKHKLFDTTETGL